MPKTIIARSLKMVLDISASIVTVAFDHDARMRPAGLILRKRMADDWGRELKFYGATNFGSWEPKFWA